MRVAPLVFLFFFFNDTATTEIYTLSLHDALPISEGLDQRVVDQDVGRGLGEQRRLVQGDLRERLTTEKIRPRGRAMTFQRIWSAAIGAGACALLVTFWSSAVGLKDGGAVVTAGPSGTL